MDFCDNLLDEVDDFFDDFFLFDILEDFLEVMVELGIIVIICLIIYFLFKKFFNKKTRKTNDKYNNNENKMEMVSLKNETAKKCRNELKEISKLESEITNVELKGLVAEIVDLSVRIIRLADDDDMKILSNFFNYYIPQFHKILDKYKLAFDASIDTDFFKDLEEDTIKNFVVFRDSLKKLIEEILRNDLDNIDAEMKVFEDFLKMRELSKSDFNL